MSLITLFRHLEVAANEHDGIYTKRVQLIANRVHLYHIGIHETVGY
jgi:hypothetical protein